MELDLERVRANVRLADAEDLLDRATVYRGEMEPAALDIIDAELARRGLTATQIQSHLEARQGVLTCHDGTVIKCHYCRRPAVQRGWSWHRLFGLIPIFPMIVHRCARHSAADKRD